MRGLAVGLLLVAGCSFKVGLSTNRGQVEKMIVDRVVAATGEKPTRRVPDHRPCTVVVAGSELHYKVTGDGTAIHFDQDRAYILVADLEKTLVPIFTPYMGGQVPKVTCPPPLVRVDVSWDRHDAHTISR